MRLTLRTMLAYLDEILEPADAQALAAKIEESEFASGLVHRIRGATRRLRLGAPRLEGKGMGLDPNTVAEYLDNTLPSDRVPDLEKVCLESDVHLAEVAACHQVLTLVLGEPAVVPPGVRDRVYRIGSMLLQAPAGTAGEGTGDGRSAMRADGAHATGAAGGTQQRDSASAGNSRGGGKNAHADSAESKVARAAPEVPDYLKAGRRSRLVPLALSVVLAFAVVGVALRAIGPFDETHPLLGSLFAPRQQQVADNSGQRDDLSSGGAGATTPDDDDAARSRTTPGGDKRLPRTAGGDLEFADKPADHDGADSQAGAGVDAGSDLVRDSALDSAAIRPDSTIGDVAPTPPEPDRDAGAASEDVEAPGVRNQEPDSLTVPPAPSGVEEGARDPDGGAVGDTPPAAAPRIDVGRYASDFQVLARLASGGEWRRLPTHAALASGDRVLAPPVFRPQVVLASGFQLTLPGPTELMLERADENALTRLTLVYGRAILVPTLGRAGANIELVLGQRRGIATFVDADSTVAVEVKLYREPGADPESAPSLPVVRLLARNGQVHWHEGPDTTIVDPDCALLLVGDESAKEETPTELPAWLEPRDYGIERLAAQTLEPLLDVERPIVVALREQTAHRQVEVRSLAVRCLSLFGIHEPVVELFNDELYKSFWNVHFDSVQDALARGPESAAQVRTALETLRRDDAAALYRILSGYSPEQLEKGGAASLVDHLNSDSLDFRVLSYLTLWRTTGFTLSYRPEVPEARRKTSAQRWRDRLAAGLIIYKTSPQPAGVSTTPLPVEEEPAP